MNKIGHVTQTRANGSNGSAASASWCSSPRLPSNCRPLTYTIASAIVTISERGRSGAEREWSTSATREKEAMIAERRNSADDAITPWTNRSSRCRTCPSTAPRSDSIRSSICSFTPPPPDACARRRRRRRRTPLEPSGRGDSSPLLPSPSPSTPHDCGDAASGSTTVAVPEAAVPEAPD